MPGARGARLPADLRLHAAWPTPTSASAEDQPVTPAFLFAVLLWEPRAPRYQELVDGGREPTWRWTRAGSERGRAQQAAGRHPQALLAARCARSGTCSRAWSSATRKPASRGCWRIRASAPPTTSWSCARSRSRRVQRTGAVVDRGAAQAARRAFRRAGGAAARRGRHRSGAAQAPPPSRRSPAQRRRGRRAAGMSAPRGGVYIGLGANLGDPARQLRRALEQLQREAPSACAALLARLPHRALGPSATSPSSSTRSPRSRPRSSPRRWSRPCSQSNARWVATATASAGVRA